jgi:GDPmannose 4,6-dehydratase
MVVIIFGVSGQDGYYLQAYLKSLGYNVLGISRSKGDIIGNVADEKFVKNVIIEYKPNYIFHFAANSTTNHYAINENNATISGGSINILESVRLYSPLTKVFLTGSAMQFKNENVPIDESTEFSSSSPYAISRVQSVMLARYFRSKYNLKIYVGYLFNHDSPLRKSDHINQKIVETVLRIKNGSSEKLLIGNLGVKKEFSFAGDIVKAIWLMVNQEVHFEVVIGSGISYSIQQWVEYCFDQMGLNWRLFVEEQYDYKSEYKELVSNPLLINQLGWEPTMNFHQLANLMLSQSNIY